MKLILTEKQAEALLRMVGEVDFPDVLQSIFLNNKNDIRRAKKVIDKIQKLKRKKGA